MALKNYMKKRHMSGKKSGLCDADGNLKGDVDGEKTEKPTKKEKKRPYLDGAK